MSAVNFSPTDAARIAKAVKRVERMPLNDSSGRPQQVGISTPAVRIGKTDASISKGSSGTVSRYIGATGSETDTGENDTVKNLFGNVASGKWVAYVLINDVYYLIAAEC